jgi:RNAse (barnase) inhibitor barstar
MFELQGGQMTDDRSLHAELAREFGFPDYYGHNWDAFNDSWAEIEPALPSPAAILWHEADATAAAALKPYTEAVVVLLDAFEAVRRRKPAKQLELFLFGDGEQFPRP